SLRAAVETRLNMGDHRRNSCTFSRPCCTQRSPDRPGAPDARGFRALGWSPRGSRRARFSCVGVVTPGPPTRAVFVRCGGHPAPHRPILVILSNFCRRNGLYIVAPESIPFRRRQMTQKRFWVLCLLILVAALPARAD